MGVVKNVLRRDLGTRDYAAVWRAMQVFTEARDGGTADEIWLVEHPPVFTLGLNGRPEHLLAPGSIPVVNVDRGGQVTYHGPGQIVLYPLLDLRRLGLGIRALVTLLESIVVEFLEARDIAAAARPEAPGVYVHGRKIAALGLRVRRGCSYHGLSFNVAMDLSPFACINPCGHAGMEVTQLADLGACMTPGGAGQELAARLARRLGHTVLIAPAGLPAASGPAGTDG